MKSECSLCPAIEQQRQQTKALTHAHIIFLGTANIKALNSVSGFHQQKLQLYTDGPEGGRTSQLTDEL